MAETRKNFSLLESLILSRGDTLELASIAHCYHNVALNKPNKIFSNL